MDVTVGAPAGKTKTILVDLEGKLEAGTRRLRLTEAFEIHWDRIALMEKKPNAATKITFITPSEADLHFRGFSPTGKPAAGLAAHTGLTTPSARTPIGPLPRAVGVRAMATSPS